MGILKRVIDTPAIYPRFFNFLKSPSSRGLSAIAELLVQGNAAIKSRCGGKFYSRLLRKFLVTMLKELLKSANIYQNGSKNKSGTVFFDSQCTSPHIPYAECLDRLGLDASFVSNLFLFPHACNHACIIYDRRRGIASADVRLDCDDERQSTAR